MYTQSEIVAQLRDMGIAPTDTVTIHSSLKAIGPIECGADGLITALRKAVCDGLLLIPAHTYQNIREIPVFDVQRTMPCIGTLPRIAVEWANKAYEQNDPTCRRSLQPSHSVVAFGKTALSYIHEDARAETALPIFGSYGKLCNAGGKILLAGVGLKKNTFMHAIHEYAPREVDNERTEITVIDYDGSETKRYNSRAYGYSGDFEKEKDILQSGGAIAYGKLGDAEVLLCDAQKCFDIVLNRIISQHK